ncbi:recombinase family protein [Algoriphagus iocasae]|uniref:recombinase family protein n=1 Tax=Algoriphagus iocasae TaxID=1836499 RepID=UPI00160F570A|nr:recombinase family protein [Algoriphagus iocasae]
MKIADLYVRVSTDDQKYGYSPRAQEEALRKYCETQGISIRKVVSEEQSAKSFERPGWQGLLSEWKRIKGKGIDLVLFCKWDRFSRNAGDAYAMINTLRKLGIEPQAIEQPLDMKVPESKIMLAIYLATPEVENDRRGLNIFFGMRRGLKEGRYLRMAPVGYINKAEGRRKYIEPVEPAASLIRWSFETVLSNVYPVDKVWEMAKEKGLKTSRANFHRMLRNPIYCGKILVPAFEDENETLVDGLHKEIVTEDEFLKVQYILANNGRLPVHTKDQTDDSFPLRGQILCPECGSVLTGSASKGRTKRYYYYHCKSSCGYRSRVHETHDRLVSELRKFSLKKSTKEVYENILTKLIESTFENGLNQKKVLSEKIEDEQKRLKNARDLLLSGDLDGTDYREIKEECNDKINKLEQKLISLNVPVSSKYTKDVINQSINRLSSLDELFVNGTTAQKRILIGSIFPEKWCFENSKSRTTRINSVVECMYLIDRDLINSKKERKTKNSSFSHWVELARFELASR